MTYDLYQLYGYFECKKTIQKTYDWKKVFPFVLNTNHLKYLNDIDDKNDLKSAKII